MPAITSDLSVVGDVTHSLYHLEPSLAYSFETYCSETLPNDACTQLQIWNPTLSVYDETTNSFQMTYTAGSFQTDRYWLGDSSLVHVIKDDAGDIIAYKSC